MLLAWRDMLHAKGRSGLQAKLKQDLIGLKYRFQEETAKLTISR